MRCEDEEGSGVILKQSPLTGAKLCRSGHGVLPPPVSMPFVSHTRFDDSDDSPLVEDPSTLRVSRVRDGVAKAADTESDDPWRRPTGQMRTRNLRAAKKGSVDTVVGFEPTTTTSARDLGAEIGGFAPVCAINIRHHLRGIRD